MAMPSERPHVTYRYATRLPHNADAAFAWLTDYRDDDATLTTTLVKERRVVARQGNTIEMQATIDPLGRPMSGKAVVTLFPEERRWVASLAGGRIVNEYVLTPTPDGGCELRVTYRTYARRWTKRIVLRLARRRFERQARLMWAGFLQAMAKDLPSAPRAAPSPAPRP